MRLNLPSRATRCQWGHTLFLVDKPTRCRKKAIATVVLTNPRRREFEGLELTVCEEHLIEAVTLANPDDDEETPWNRLVMFSVFLMPGSSDLAIALAA